MTDQVAKISPLPCDCRGEAARLRGMPRVSLNARRLRLRAAGLGRGGLVSRDPTAPPPNLPLPSQGEELKA